MAPPTEEATLRVRRTGGCWRTELLAGVLRRLLGLAWPRRARPSQRAIALGPDATLALRPGRGGLVLTCRSGEFLITQAGDPADHVLGAGEVFRTAARGRVVAWALRPGVLIGPARR